MTHEEKLEEVCKKHGLTVKEFQSKKNTKLIPVKAKIIKELTKTLSVYRIAKLMKRSSDTAIYWYLKKYGKNQKEKVSRETR